MCWGTTNPSFMREYRAIEDMRVYKILLVREDRFGKTEFVSPCQGFHYKPGKIYHAELGVTKTDDSLIINEGLHCFYNMASAGMYADSIMGIPIIVTAIIPKGAKYYINGDKEIVTEKLKIIL